MRSTVKKKKKKKRSVTVSEPRCLQRQISKKVFRVDVAFSRRRKVHASEAVNRQISIALLKAKLISLQFDTLLMYTGHPLLSMQKKRKKQQKSYSSSTVRDCLLVFFFSKWTLNLQGSTPACVRQTTLFEQVVRNSEDFIGNRNLRSMMSVW